MMTTSHLSFALKRWARRLAGVSSLTVIAFAAGCATTGPRNPMVTVEDVVQLSHQGVPPKEIIDRMRQSGTIYRLSGSQLAELKDRGVAGPVLDYMQETYLQDVRDDLVRRASYDGYGPSAWGPYWGGYWGPPVEVLPAK